MKRSERPKLEIKPTPKEIFYSLITMPKWINILARNGEEKKYTPFLNLLCNIENLGLSEFPIVKETALKYGFTQVQINRWIKEIYDDIFDLSCSNPELFYKDREIPIEFVFENLGNNAFLSFSLPSVPKIYEEINIRFLNAKLHTYIFWIEEVQYQIADPENTIIIKAKGGICNKYRDFAIDKAMFERKLHFHERWYLTDTEIDDIVLSR